MGAWLLAWLRGCLHANLYARTRGHHMERPTLRLRPAAANGTNHHHHHHCQGFTVHHETHRGRYFFHPRPTRDMLALYPDLTLTADLSHWRECVRECIDPWVLCLCRVGRARACMLAAIPSLLPLRNARRATTGLPTAGTDGSNRARVRRGRPSAGGPRRRHCRPRPSHPRPRRPRPRPAGANARGGGEWAGDLFCMQALTQLGCHQVANPRASDAKQATQGMEALWDRIWAAQQAAVGSWWR